VSKAERRMRALPAFSANRAEAICCITKWTDLKKKMPKSPHAPCIPTAVSLPNGFDPDGE